MCRVLIADDSQIMLKVLRKTLEEERKIDIVGEAETFAQTVQMIADLKPDVLLLDLHLPEKRAISRELVKSQLQCVRTLAVSLANDAEAKALAESYGAVLLLDKMNLYNELIPAIMRCLNNKSVSASA